MNFLLTTIFQSFWRGWFTVLLLLSGVPFSPCFFNPLALRALPLSHLRWAEGEDWNVASSVLNSSIAVHRSITGCGVSHIREVAHSDREVEKDNMFFAWRFSPLALRALPLSHLWWAEGECWYLDAFPLLWIFRSCFKFIPRQGLNMAGKHTCLQW